MNWNTDMKITNIKIVNKHTEGIVFCVHSLQMHSSESRFAHYNHESLSKSALLKRRLLRTTPHTLKAHIIKAHDHDPVHRHPNCDQENLIRGVDDGVRLHNFIT